MESERPKRKAIPPRVKLASALILAGMHPTAAVALVNDRGGFRTSFSALALCPAVLRAIGTALIPYSDDVEWDHEPPLALRAVNAAGDDYDPPQLDPRHIVPRDRVAHRTKTTGTPPGQKVVHVANGDQHKIAKAKRQADRWAEHEARVASLKAGDVDAVIPNLRGPYKQWPKGRKMQSRPFPKKAKPNG